MHIATRPNPLRHNGVFTLKDGREVIATDTLVLLGVPGWIVATRSAYSDDYTARLARYGDVVCTWNKDERAFSPDDIATDTGTDGAWGMEPSDGDEA